MPIRFDARNTVPTTTILEPTTTPPPASSTLDPLTSPPPTAIGLPRRNLHETPQPPVTGFGSWLSSLFHNHGRAAASVIAGSASLAGVAHAAPAVVAPTTDVVTPPTTTTAAVTEAFEPGKLTEYPLFKLFWHSPDAADGTSHEGLDEATPAGVQKMITYAKTHNLDGTPSTDNTISPAEKQLITTLLEHRDFGTFFELDALPVLFAGFDIKPAAVHSVAVEAAEAKHALAKVLGVGESEIKLSFPKAGRTHETTYLSMDGKMADPMKFVDEYRAALGMEKGAEGYEKAPVLGWMMGETAGHTKYGSFNEKTPFSTSGINWGKLLFPNDKDVASLPVKGGFEFPIDALTGFNRSVGGFTSEGDKIVPHDAQGNELKITKVINKDASGKPVSWSATFTKADGTEVKADDVIGLIKDRFGNTKGDGKVSGSMSMGWWGFCDRNTAGTLYKSKFEVPNVDRDVKIVVNGKTITIPKDEAQKLLDVDMSDMAGRAGMVGARFNDEPAKIKLLDGSTVTGMVKGMDLHMGPNATRGSGDNVTIRNSDAHPMLGSIQLESSWGGKNMIDLENVESITKGPNGEVEIKMFGEDYTQKGKLATNISFEGGVTGADGRVTITNTKDKPIIGSIYVDIGGGELKEISASKVKTIAGEMQSEMKVSEYLDFIMRNDGMYATDNAQGVIVSNGMRWVNKIDVHMFEGTETPDWAKGKLMGVEGKLVRQTGDKLMMVDGQYKSGYGDSMSSQFKGWIQLDSAGKTINQGFISGEPDFGWAAEGPLDWNAESSFNPFMTPDLRLKLLVNGVTDMSKLESMAKKLNLPSDWKSLRTPGT